MAAVGLPPWTTWCPMPPPVPSRPYPPKWPACLTPAGLITGLLLTVAGYAATIWCYVTMGNAWRIGIDREEKNRLVTDGPFRRIRHPIYAFQDLMLLGAVFLLPTICSIVVLVVHLSCVFAKARDEEAYLMGVHGEEYRQ